MMSANESTVLKFPPGFRWSVASSAHQVEGGNEHSDWWEFESRPGTIKRGERSGRAADHWNRVEQDVALIKSLNLNHARISVEWARIEPVRGKIDAGALAHYVNEVTLLKTSGIEPLVTLQHFTLPKWVAALDGWGWNEMPAAFARYAEVVYEALGAFVTDWITINEPMVLVVAGYVSGDFPPAKKSPKEIFLPLCGIVRSHARAYHVMHALAKKAKRHIRIGMAHHLRVFDPARRWHPMDRLASSVLGNAFNWIIPDALRSGHLRTTLPLITKFRTEIPEARGTEDFVGLNYYSRDLIRFAPRRPNGFVRVDLADQWRSDLGWEIYPYGILRVLRDIAKRYPKVPVMVTENGLADADDKSRVRFIHDHLVQIHRAIHEGIPVECYSHWSLLDNFEWAEGFAPRFGLFDVNYDSFARTARPSAMAYAKMAQENAIFPRAT